jgi:hypothetical protein
MTPILKFHPADSQPVEDRQFAIRQLINEADAELQRLHDQVDQVQKKRAHLLAQLAGVNRRIKIAS